MTNNDQPGWDSPDSDPIGDVRRIRDAMKADYNERTSEDEATVVYFEITAHGTYEPLILVGVEVDGEDPHPLNFDGLGPLLRWSGEAPPKLGDPVAVATRRSVREGVETADPAGHLSDYERLRRVAWMARAL